MIKLLLKHMIFEQCLNVLFDNLNENFRPPPKVPPRMVGSMVKRLSDVETYQQYALPLIRRQFPTLLADKMPSHPFTGDLKKHMAKEYASRFID